MIRKKTSYKLLALDLDGTLLSPVLRKAKWADCAALQEYMSCGGLLMINTGRAPWATRSAVKRINRAGKNKVKLFSFLNGSYIKDLNDSTVIETKVSHAYATKILEIAKNHPKVNVWLYLPKGINCRSVYAKPRQWYMSFSPLSKVVPLDESWDLSCYKIDIISMNKKALVKLHQDLIDHNLNQIVTIVRSSPHLVEVTALDTNKGKAINYFAQKYKIEKSEIVAMGDSFNDLSAFKNSGLAIGINPKNLNLLEHCGAIIKHKSKGVASSIRSLVLKEVNDSNFKFIFTDLDGTLIDSKTKLFSNETKFALQQCTNHLIPIAIASGRGIHDCLRIAKAMELNPKTNVYIIGNNGATIYDIFNNKYISQFPIDYKTSNKIFTELKQLVKDANGKMGFVVHPHGSELLFYNESFWKPVNLRKTGFENRCDPWVESDSIYINELPKHVDCYKFVVKYPNSKSAKAGLDKLIKTFPDMEICLSSDVNIEINRKGISKGFAAKKLADKTHVDLSTAIALGDGQNDISVFDICPNSFAPDYAPEAVKAKAKYVMPNAGACNFVSTVIDQWVLKGEKDE